MKSKIITALIENPEWYQSLVYQGVPLDPDQGEQIQQCAEKIADVLMKGPFLTFNMYGQILLEGITEGIRNHIMSEEE